MGVQLARRIEQGISATVAASDGEKTRSDVIGDIADSTERTRGTINSILNWPIPDDEDSEHPENRINCPPERSDDAGETPFYGPCASVLVDTSADDLIEAAAADGCSVGSNRNSEDEMSQTQTKLSAPPKYYRAVAKGAGNVHRTGGMFEAGYIENVSVVQRGEAFGHDEWIDADFVSDVTAAINGSEKGIKARFAHPGLSSDGLGKYLGRFTSAKTVGERTGATLHFAKTAHNTPQGNLAEYVMDLAEEDPEAFGSSVVFSHDKPAMSEFRKRHTAHGKFVSPDSGNSNNFVHVRLSKLIAADIVDDPAGNPHGLFHRNQQPLEAEQLLDYAFGLSDESPDVSQFDMHPERARQFIRRYMSRRGLSISQTTEKKTDDDDRQAILQRLSRLQ